jgi:hypothetical protein
MKKLIYLIILALILGLVLTGCSLLSNISQVPATEQSGITYLTKNPALPDLVGLWHFYDNALDSSGNNNHGTVHGATYVDGMFGKALSFDGINNYVEVTDPGIGSSLDVDRITIEAWIWIDPGLGTGQKNIVRKGYLGNRCYGLDIGLRAAGEIAGWVNLGLAGGSTALIARGSVLSPGSWYHVAMTYDGVNVCVYVDGTQVGISTTLSGNIFDNNLSVRIGGQPATDSGGALAFKGLIDEVRIWSSALTEDKLGDIIPPEVNISFPYPGGLNGWFVTSPVVGSVTATDFFNVTAIGVTGATLSAVTGLGTTTASGTLTVSAEGINDIIATATDGVGNTGAASGSSNTETIKIDTKKPVVTASLPGTGVYLMNEVVSATWSATDPTPGSGLATASSGTVSVDTSSVGAKTLIVPAGTATDFAGNESLLVTKTYYIRYFFGGILQPINADGSSIFKLGSTIPVKFQLTDYNGNFVTIAVATIKVAKVSDGIVGDDIEAISTSAATTGNLFRLADSQYIFNLATKPLSKGTWQIKITLDDGTSQPVNISLK